MSKELVRDIYREGFITALCGMEPNAGWIVMKGNKYSDAYELGRIHGNQAKTEREGMKIRNEIDGLINDFKEVAS